MNKRQSYMIVQTQSNSSLNNQNQSYIRKHLGGKLSPYKKGTDLSGDNELLVGMGEIQEGINEDYSRAKNARLSSEKRITEEEHQMFEERRNSSMCLKKDEKRN